MGGDSEAPPERLWALLLSAWAAGVCLLVVWALFSEPRPPPLWDDGLRNRTDTRWLKGLVGMEEVHFARFRGGKLFWELWAPSGNVRLQRYAFGFLRNRPLLHLAQPRASIAGPSGRMEIRAQRVYFDPKAGEWIFVQGNFRLRERTTEFRRLHWFPARNRLEFHTGRAPHPLFRLRDPIY